MWDIANQIQKALTTLNITGTQLTPDLAQLTRERARKKFASRQDGSLWQHLTEVVSIQDAEAWKWVGSYHSDHPSILFFEPEDDLAAFEFSHTRDIPLVLSECTGFEFYVTNTNSEFLLCFNHHDFLIAAGDARTWLVEYAAARSSEP